MKTTKRALFSSVMALILCFSMLVGTTFAWFTDEVKSANNIITAGNLDIELYHQDKGTNGQDEKVESTTKLFDDVDSLLWEPGAMAWEKLTIKNEGSLDLKYQFNLNALEATIVKDVNGNDVSFASMLKIAVVDENFEYTRPNVEAIEASKWSDLASFTESGNLTDGASKTVGIIIWWQPSANDNLFNMNNENKGKTVSVKVGVTLFATQVEGEFDSFDEKYDEDAWHPEMQVYTASDLQAALNNGETNIVLMNDIEADESIVIPAPTTSNAMRSADNAVVLDLNGKTLTGTTGRDAEGNRVHVLVNNGNLVLTNGTVESAGKNGGSAIYNAAGATLVLENVTVLGAPKDGSSWPSYGINNYGYMVVEDATVKTYHGGIATADGAETIINYANVDVGQGTATAITSYTLYTYGTAKLTVNGGIFANTASDAKGTGGAIVCQSGDNAIIITGGSFSGGCGLYGDFVISGGTFDRDVKNLVAEGYKSVDNDDGTFTVLFPQESFDSLIENAGENATIEIPAGTYTFPDSKLQAGMTLNCAPGTVFEGKTSLNIKGATVVGATFTSEGGYLVNKQTINGTFKDCVFTNSDGLRYCYAGETVVFENCVFDTDFYGVHFDGGANDVVFKNCTFSGFNTFGGAVTMLTMEGCTFKYNGNGGYNGINLWGDATLTDCTFVFDGSAAYEWVDLCNDNKTVTFTNCVVTDGKTEKGVEAVVGIYGEGNTVLVDGVYVVGTADTLKAALSSEAENVKIVLSNDVSIDIGTGWKMGGANTKSITIDGNGKKLTLSNTYRSYFNLANAEGVLNLKNMTLTNTHKGTHFFDYTTHFNCDVVAENVVFAKSPLVSNGATAVFNDCAFSQAGTDIYGLWIMSGTNVTVNGGKLTTDRGFKIADEDSAEELTKLTVSGTKFNNTKKAAILVTTNYGAEITLSNVDITNCGADSTNAVWIDDGRTDTADKIVVTGGSVVIEPNS